jgi:hypothetical protein
MSHMRIYLDGKCVGAVIWSGDIREFPVNMGKFAGKRYISLEAEELRIE